jgi:hypothetical protein
MPCTDLRKAPCSPKFFIEPLAMADLGQPGEAPDVDVENPSRPGVLRAAIEAIRLMRKRGCFSSE